MQTDVKKMRIRIRHFVVKNLFLRPKKSLATTAEIRCGNVPVFKGFNSQVIDLPADFGPGRGRWKEHHLKKLQISLVGPKLEHKAVTFSRTIVNGDLFVWLDNYYDHSVGPVRLEFWR